MSKGSKQRPTDKKAFGLACMEFEPGVSGNPDGRPPLFKSPEELEAKIAEYFRQVEIANVDRKEPLPPTINGLVYHLGCHRDSFNEWSRKPLFSDIVKRALTKAAIEWEARLAGNNSTGAIFWLKNQGWKDTQTIAGDSENPLNVNHGLSESTQSLIDSITKV